MFIGWWLEPIKVFFNILIILTSLIPDVKNNKKYDDEEEKWYSESDIEDIKRDLRSDIEDEIHNKIECKVRTEIEKEYYGNAKTKIKQKTEMKEVATLYDSNNGIYPPGLYVVGDDIEKGKYLLIAEKGEYVDPMVFLSASYKDFKNNNYVFAERFKDDYYLALRDDGAVIQIRNASIKRL
jgi:regulator of replication initiation timing